MATKTDSYFKGGIPTLTPYAELERQNAQLLAALEALLAQADETYPHFEDVRGTANRAAARAAIEAARA